VKMMIQGVPVDLLSFVHGQNAVQMLKVSLLSWENQKVESSISRMRKTEETQLHWCHL
jgi:phosphoribosylcarboxyaminoimidazole (NCAIR) mutase